MRFKTINKGMRGLEFRHDIRTSEGGMPCWGKKTARDELGKTSVVKG